MKIFLVILFVIVAVIGLYYWRQITLSAETNLSIADKVTYKIEIRDNALSRAKGLSGREVLDEDTGMLFVFSSPAPRHFWMKDMNFPLDIIWIADFKVMGIEENIPHPAVNNGKTARMSSPAPADMVLEINAGAVEKYGIAVGDAIGLTFPYPPAPLSIRGQGGRDRDRQL